MDCMNIINNIMINKLTEENEFLTIFVDELINEMGNLEEYYKSELEMRDEMINQQKEEIELLERKIRCYDKMTRVLNKKSSEI